MRTFTFEFVEQAECLLNFIYVSLLPISNIGYQQTRSNVIDLAQ